MKKKIFIITALLFLLSISAVCAEEVNQTDDSLEVDSDDKLSVGEPKTFTDLSNDFDNSPQTHIDITSDYKFNNQTDKNRNVGVKSTFNGGKFTFNGNNHVIDASKQAYVFHFTNGTVIINNLKICNAKQSSIILYNCILYTNNVTFENNYDGEGMGGAVYAQQSDYYSNNDKFINNHAKKGASIYALNSIVNIYQSTFKSDKAVEWGLIYAYDSITTLNDTDFKNLTSDYATVIFCEKNKLYVFNSAFIDLFAKRTAGAIGLKNMSSVEITKCSFINASSSRNGGAIYADLNGDGCSLSNTVNIRSSLFSNCSSEFGGAYLQLGGIMNIVGSKFENNLASYSGGAVYVSNTTSLIGNSQFNNNKAKRNGGAVFVDDSKISITSCDLINSTAGNLGSGVYSYSSGYEIKNNLISKNNGTVIISYFDRKGSSMNSNDLLDGKVLLNQVLYNAVIDSKGTLIPLDPTLKVNETAKSSAFDLRNYTMSGVVKNQGNVGSCWAFAATGAMESAFLKATGYLLDLSENNIKNAALHYGIYGCDYQYERGYVDSGLGFFVSWLGLVNISDDYYDELGKISETKVTDGSYHIQNAIIVPPRQNSLDNEKLKDALVKYGGLTVHIYGAVSNNDYYNKNTYAQYYNGKEPGNHFVTLVGWNDTYSKDNFLIKPEGDGAWICKNSWGSEWGDEGYFYVSYYDTSFARYTSSVGYILNNTESYDRLYQYDIGMFAGYFKEKDKGEMRIINKYNATKNELISAVGSYFETANESYTITVYVDGKAVYTQSGVSSFGGFETIKLNKKIAVNYGHEFSVEIKERSVPLLEETRIHFESGKTLLYRSDNKLEDLGSNGKTACIKVYTLTNPNPEKTKSIYYTKNRTVTVKSNSNGKLLTISKDNKALGSATVNNGEAKFNLILEPGVYSISTQYDEDDEFVELFEIINTIDVDDSITIGYNAQPTIEAEFIDENGVALFDYDVTYTIDGKNYTGYIDNNDGILYLTLPKLSVGVHTLVLENPETLEEATTTINVISRLVGNSNVKMYYADGSTFKVLVNGADGNHVGANEIVAIKVNKVTYNVKTDSNGYATLVLPNTLKPGTYELTATYAGQTVKNTVKVKQILKLAKVKVKKSAKKLVIKATLKKGKTPIKSTKLTFKFKGKTYKAKTNKKGVAKITVKKSVLKKLKVGKKIKYKVTYLKNTVKRTVKVKK